MSHPLIDQLKKEHALLASLLEEVKTAGIQSKEGQAALVKAKNALISHLKREDQQLYPPLAQVAKNDRRLSSIMDMYAKDMEQVSKTAMAFFDKYGGGGSGFQFAADYGSLVAQLKRRIKNEESELYKEFERLQGGGAATSAR